MTIISTNVGTIIQTACGLAQLDSSFYNLARTYYNLILEKISKDYQYLYFRKTEPDVQLIAGQTDYDLPVDYQRSDTCYLVDQAGKQGREILIMDSYDFAPYRADTVNGDPGVATIDLGLRKIKFSTSTNSGAKYRLNYFRQPNGIDLEGGDDASQPDFEDPKTLIDQLVAWLMEYRDDERQMAKSKMADMSLAKTKLQSYDSDSDSKVQMSHATYRPGRRPNRGGGGSGSPWGS